MNEKIVNLNQEREERFEKLQSTISYHVHLFLELCNMPRIEIVWDERSSLTELGFTLIEPDSGETLLTGERLHQELIQYLIEADIKELRNYERNIYAPGNIISFIKIPNN